MSFKLYPTDPFIRKVKKLAKKYKSIKSDLSDLFDELYANPKLGSPLGLDCYKVRMSITSKQKGKSGGARIITYVVIDEKSIYLLDIYDKYEKSSITDKELKSMIKLLKD